MERKKKVSTILKRLQKNAELGDIPFSVSKKGFNTTAYVEIFIEEETLKVIVEQLVVNPNTVDNDTHLEIALCHELGHIKDLMYKGVSRKFYDNPDGLWNRIAKEIRSDRWALRIYGRPDARKKLIYSHCSGVKRIFRYAKKNSKCREFLIRHLTMAFIRFLAAIFISAPDLTMKDEIVRTEIKKNA